MKKIITSLLLITFCTGQVVLASNSPPMKQKTFKTLNKNDKIHFEKYIEENGQKYKLDKVDYKIIKEEDTNKLKDLIHNIKYKDLYNSNNIPAPKKQIEVEKDGILVKMKLAEKLIEETTIVNRYETVTADQEIKDFTPKINEPIDPIVKDKKVFSYDDKKNNKTTDVVLNLKSLEKISDDFFISEKLELELNIYNSNFFQLGGKYVEYDPKKLDLSKYEQEVLDELELNPDYYTLIKAYYNSKEYEENNMLKRKAVIAVKRRASNYIATYESKVQLEPANGYNVTLKYVYDNNNNANIKSDTEYTIKAIASYKYNEDLKTIIISLITILFLLFIVIFLRKLLQKQDKQEKEQK